MKNSSTFIYSFPRGKHFLKCFIFIKNESTLLLLFFWYRKNIFKNGMTGLRIIGETLQNQKAKFICHQLQDTSTVLWVVWTWAGLLVFIFLVFNMGGHKLLFGIIIFLLNKNTLSWSLWLLPFHLLSPWSTLPVSRNSAVLELLFQQTGPSFHVAHRLQPEAHGSGMSRPEKPIRSFTNLILQIISVCYLENVWARIVPRKEANSET